MTSAETVFIFVAAFISVSITAVGIIWQFLRLLKAVFDLGRKTAKRYPWRESSATPNSDFVDSLN